MKSLYYICILVCLCVLTSCGAKKSAVSDISAEDYIAAELKQQHGDKKVKQGKKQGKSDTDRLLAEAYSWRGTPYLYGGQSRKGTDCSGFVMAVYQNALGIKIPRTTREQSDYCTAIKRSQLRSGDLVFFNGGKKGKVSHVGLYVGDGKFIHASSSRGVIVSDLGESYYQRNYNHCGRILK